MSFLQLPNTLPNVLQYKIRSYLPSHPLSLIIKEAILWIQKQRNKGKIDLTVTELSHLYYDDYYYRCKIKGVFDKSKFYNLKKFYLLNKMFTEI